MHVDAIQDCLQDQPRPARRGAKKRWPLSRKTLAYPNRILSIEAGAIVVLCSKIPSTASLGAS